MWKPLLWAALVGGALACSGADREIVVTAEEFGSDWPLSVGSAVIECGAGDVALLKLGVERYALSDAAAAQGYPDARTITRAVPIDPAQREIGTTRADVEALRAVCDGQVAAGG